MKGSKLDIEIMGQYKDDGGKKFISDFAQWKLEIGNDFPTAKDAWDYQERVLANMQNKIMAAANVISKNRQVTAELHEFIKEQIELIDEQALKLKWYSDKYGEIPEDV